MRLKILFDASNIIKGGAVQAAINFIMFSVNDDRYEWYYLLSSIVVEELDQLDIRVDALVLAESTSKSLTSRKRAVEFEGRVSPKLVFTLFGPSYIKFSTHHLTGFANGWVTHSSLNTFLLTYPNDKLQIIRSALKYIYYGLNVRRADGFVFETETARNGFVNRFFIDKTNTYVVPNSCLEFGGDFSKKSEVVINNVHLSSDDNLLMLLAADYPQKNLAIIKDVVYYLKNQKKVNNFKFVFTLPDDVWKDRFRPFFRENDLLKYVVNLGRVSFSDLSEFYSVAYASVLISQIETFSAVYPESFSSGTPVITSDEEFSRGVCGDSVLYVDQNSVSSISEGILFFLKNPDQVNGFVERGKKRFSEILLSPQEKFDTYLNIIEKELAKITL